LWEEKVIRRIGAVRDERWLNKQNTGKDFYGGPLSETHKAKISAAHKGKTRSKEQKAAMSAARKGKPKSDEFRKNLSLVNKGKIFSEETRAKISAAKKRQAKSVTRGCVILKRRERR
jgi:hypothetical protein